MSYLKGIIASVVLGISGSLFAQQPPSDDETFKMQHSIDCAKTDVIIKFLAKYGEEAQHSSANTAQGYVITFWYNATTGTSTYTGTFVADGVTCILADGKRTVFRNTI